MLRAVRADEGGKRKNAKMILPATNPRCEGKAFGVQNESSQCIVANGGCKVEREE